MDELLKDAALDKVIEEKVQAQVAKALTPEAKTRFKSGIMSDESRFQYVRNIWSNDGWEDPVQKEINSLSKNLDRNTGRHNFDGLVEAINSSANRAKKAISSDASLQDNIGLPTDATILLPRVITAVVREAIEPQLVLTSLLRRINFSGGEQITFPAASAITAQDIGPGMEYPERRLEFAGVVKANIGKVGVKIRITEEMLRYSQFDVMSLHFRAAGRALARHKEVKVANLINNNGTTIFDNSGAASLRGKTQGRGRNAAGNNTIILDDIFQMYADLLNGGFIPNTIMMNPMGWLIFMRDPVLRSFGFANGGPLWGTRQGNVGLRPGYGSQGPSIGAPPTTTAAEMSNATLYSPVPGLFPAPLSIVVSPFIAYNASAQTTSIIMADREELGVLIVDEEVVTESWDDPNRDIRATKFRERYGLGVDNEGDAIAVAKGISLSRGFDFENMLVRYNLGTGDTLPPIV